MTIPQQLAPTVGPAHGGVEFLEGPNSGIKKLVIDQMKKESAWSNHAEEPENFCWKIRIMVKALGTGGYEICKDVRVCVRRLTCCTATS